MKWAGIDGDVFCTKEGNVPFLSVLQMYDCFEQIIELFLKTMETIFVRISTDNGNLALRMMIAARIRKKEWTASNDRAGTGSDLMKIPYIRLLWKRMSG